jgi:hypothetical protein
MEMSKPEGIAKMVCNICDKDSADGFKFCPHCGNAFTPALSVNEPPIPPPEIQSVTGTLTDESEPIRDGVAGTAIRVGTLVFGAFAAISLLVSIVKGLVPIYLLEAAGWAGVAWYWQKKKTHSELAKAIVIVLAVLVAIGEVVHIASRPDSKSTASTASDPFAAYGGHEVASSETSVASQPSQGETQDKANSEEAHPKQEPKPSEKPRTGLEATISCDNTVWDRDKYGEGDPLAITNVHKGDIVQYVGHVTVGDEDIIRVHGRKGYVDGCVDVKLTQDAGDSDEAQLKTEPKPRKGKLAGIEATITCDNIVWDRDKYGEGDPLAVTNVRQGDIVQYVGHVTVGDEDIIRVHGRKGYVDGCVDVKQ